MKKIILVVFAFFVFINTVFAGWDIIKPTAKSHFISPDDQLIHTINIIKSEDSDNAVVYFNYYSNEITQGTIERPTCVIRDGAGWLGRLVVFNNDGTQEFKNKDNDLILFRKIAEKGNSWRMTDLERGNYIKATVTGKTFEEILPGISDSVKTIELAVMNIQDNRVPSPLNGKKFRLSKNHGLIELYNMYFFPDSLIRITLAGIENIAGLKPITFKDVFDFDIGDEFHIYEGDTSTTNYGILKWRRITVVDKTFFENEQVVDYEVKHEIMEVRFYTQVYDTSYSDNFVHLRYDLRKYRDYLPEQSYLTFPRREDTMLTMNKFFYGEYGGRQVIRTWKLYERFIPPCFIPTNRIGIKYYSYIEGCGDFFEQDYGYQKVWRRLLYLNKNGTEWGKKLDFIVSVQENTDAAHTPEIINEILINDPILKISTDSDGFYKINIFDINGKKVRSGSYYFSNGINEIPLEHLQNGFYFVHFSRNGKLFYGKFLLIE